MKEHAINFHFVGIESTVTATLRFDDGRTQTVVIRPAEDFLNNLVLEETPIAVVFDNGKVLRGEFVDLEDDHRNGITLYIRPTGHLSCRAFNFERISAYFYDI